MRARHIVATVCAAGLIATACGSDDSSSEDTSPAETDAPADAGDGGADWPDQLVFTLTPSQETGGLIETAQPLA
ncbi:MAG: hypothetical protein QNM02_21470, partial [Acidimicrobiia bacterium]|nr:hypothetical protein [Acidimicrobiia bacterium]